MTPIFMLVIAFSGPANEVVTMTPFDVQNPDLPGSLFSGISQIAIDRELLYLRPSNDQRVLVFDRGGNFQKAIGRQGGGPGELKHQMQAFDVRGARLWVLAHNGSRALYFENGTFMHEFPLEGYNIHYFNQTAQAFAHDQDRLLIPAHPTSGHLAQVYDYGGNLIAGVGELLPPDRELLYKNPALNDTMWATDGDQWYCLFKYQPLLVTFDAQFNEIARFDLVGPEITERNEALLEHVPKRRDRFPLAHFNDFKIHQGHAYTICGKALYRIDLKTGVVLSRTKFAAASDEVGDDLAGRPLRLFYFAIFADGTIILGHPALPWDHDLWQAKLPYL